MDEIMKTFLENEVLKDYLKERLIPVQNRIIEIDIVLKVFNNREKVTVNIEKCLSKMIYGISLQSEDWFNNAFLKTIFEKFMVYSDGKIEVIIKIDANYEEKFQVPKYTNHINRKCNLELYKLEWSLLVG